MMSITVMLWAVLLLSACGSKEDSIRGLENLSADMSLRSANYTEDEWTEAFEKYQKLSNKLQGEELTPEQQLRLVKAKGEISRVFAKQLAKELAPTLRNILNETEDFVEGFVDALPEATRELKE